MKKWLTLLLGGACALSVFSFAACGGEGDTPSSSSEDSTEGVTVPKTAYEAYASVVESYKKYANNFTSTTTYRETYSVSGDFTNSGVNTGTQIMKADGENRYVKISANWNEEDIYEREHHLVDGTRYRAVLVDGETSKDKHPQSAEEWEENLVDKEYAWSATDFPVYEYETELEEKLSMVVRDEEIVLTLTIEGALAETWAYRFYTGADHYAPTKVEYKLYLNEALEMESIEIQIDSYDDSLGARVYESTTYVDCFQRLGKHDGSGACRRRGIYGDQLKA